VGKVCPQAESRIIKMAVEIGNNQRRGQRGKEPHIYERGVSAVEKGDRLQRNHKKFRGGRISGFKNRHCRLLHFSKKVPNQRVRIPHNDLKKNPFPGGKDCDGKGFTVIKKVREQANCFFISRKQKKRVPDSRLTWRYEVSAGSGGGTFADREDQHDGADAAKI